MIYTIKNDATGAIVYDPRVPDAVVVDPVLKQKDNSFGALEFAMYPTHPEYAGLSKRRSIYAVHRDDAVNPMWRGILVSGTEDVDTAVDYYFEDFMSVLRDSMQEPFEFTGSPTDLFVQFLTAHNAQVEPWQRVQPGIVAVTDPNDYINRSSIYELTTWEAIETRLINPLGGHLRMRYVGGVSYLDYLEGSTSSLDPNLNASSQRIELGENLKSLSRLISASETYTACLPKGAEITKYDADGNEYETRLTIEDVNDGSKYIVDMDAVALYGYRCAPIEDTTWDDVTIAANLKTKAQEYLAGTAIKLRDTIKLTAVDLRHLGVASDSYGFLDYIEVSLHTHGINAIYLLTEITIPLDDPAELEISLGDTALSLTDKFAQSAASAQQQLDEIAQTVTVNEKQLGAEVARTTLELRSLIEQTGEMIVSQVSEAYTSTTSFAEFQSQISTMFTQTADEFEMQFTAIASSMTTFEGAVNTQLSTINKYIRFVDGNILLGEDGNPLVLKITNEKISFLYNNVEIAYFSSGRLYVDQLEAITTLTLGQFAFKPDSSGGMALKYIGE